MLSLKKWNPVSNDTVKVETSKSHEITGIQSNTAIFKPETSGIHKININGQILKINVVNTTSGFIDNFEDYPDGIYDKNGETLSDFYDGNLGAATRSQTNVKEGSYSLKISSGGGNNGIGSPYNGGLNAYPERGTTFQLWVRPFSGSRVYIGWCGQFSTYGGRPDNVDYVTTIEEDSNSFNLSRPQDNVSGSASLSGGKWYRFEFDFGDTRNDTITVDLFDSNNNNNIGTNEIVDTESNKGGISFTSDNDSSSGTTVFDNYKII